MWGPPSQLDLSYEIRHMRRFKDKHQRPLTDKEKEILDRIKKVDPNNFGKKCKGLTMPQLNVLKVNYLNSSRTAHFCTQFSKGLYFDERVRFGFISWYLE